MNSKVRSQSILAASIIIGVLVIDQIIKLWIKMNFTLDESYRITDWFYLHFVENNGMAWGMTFFNKLILSVTRLFWIAVITNYLFKVIKTGKERNIYVIFIAMVISGAFGNMIDSMLYGLMFSGASYDYVSYLVPFGTGYGSFLTGKVVDMFYFPLFSFNWPDWLPFIGGNRFEFFDAIFNFADASISCGVIGLLLFCTKDLEEVANDVETWWDRQKLNIKNLFSKK